MWDDQTHPFSQWVPHGAQRCVCFWGGLVSLSLEKMQCLFPQSRWTWPVLLSKYLPQKPAVKPAWRHAHLSWEQPQDADRNTRVCTIDKNSHFFSHKEKQPFYSVWEEMRNVYNLVQRRDMIREKIFLFTTRNAG